MLCVYLVSGCIACLLCVNVVYAVCVGGVYLYNQMLEAWKEVHLGPIIKIKLR